MKISGTGPWTLIRVVAKSSATVNGLTSGQRVWFRVATKGHGATRGRRLCRM